MKVLDMHIHAWGTKPDPDNLIANMEKAGVWGGCVMSYRAKETDPVNGLEFDERVEEALAWCKGYEGRLFPVVWIHPCEKNLCENVKRAVEQGICGFKIICHDFYVYEEACMEVLRTIAQLNVPVFFHSGILWDGTDSSKYNRPVHWEVLSKIPGLRFSLGHCSWPWLDECFAVYGQFLNAKGHGNPAEMFFDTTPGTPVIYRKDLFSKLFTGGYDTGHNVMFGSDCFAHDYKPEWAKKWLKIDGDLMREFGVCKEIFENCYYHNVLRFLGKEPQVEHNIPKPDDAGGWSATNPQVPAVIEKWYQKLGFPNYFDEEFYRAVKEIPISDAITVTTYDVDCQDGKRNLLSALFLAEKLSETYRAKGISEEILMDSLHDILTYTHIFSDLKNELSLGRMNWILRILNGEIIRLGRLQFVLENALVDIPQKGIKAGDSVLRCYIPQGEKLTCDTVLSSIEQAKEFFGDYTIVVTSWLLDDSLKEILPETSNILLFQSLFETVKKEESDSILRYVFRWNTNRFSVKYVPTYNTFSKRVKQAVLSGRRFYEVTGYLK
ncbi:MAG: amidohydrolase family protein [Clostridia bacterium]|nr:amidohydrolase family protein [Clostridia bacterium]